MARLFGTDGVRGVAGEFLTAELALALARGAVSLIDKERPQVVIVRDTRLSGEMLEAAIAAGVAAAGGDALLAGVLPTPAVPVLTRQYGLDLGIVISASHNPYRDNGIKFFGADGFKSSDEFERTLEERIELESTETTEIGHVRELRGAFTDYLRALEQRFGGLDLSGRQIALDCANGATYKVASEIFRRLGAKVTVIADAPDGYNINAGCGSTHLDGLCELMRAGGHDIGFAFDGDGDRVLAVDRSGVVVDGDELIALATLHLQNADLLGGGVAVTVMTNYGFHQGMAAAGVEVVTTPVGDRHVLQELSARGWRLGGEQSGHIIDMDFVPTGDGIASALLTIEALAGRDLRERAAMQKLPQKLVNVEVSDHLAVSESSALREATERAQAELEGRGRVLVRPSGTEPLVRVMVEAPTEAEAVATCERLVAVIDQITVAVS